MTPLQVQAVESLQTWVAQHGAHSLSTRLIHGDKPAQAVYNKCNYAFGKYRPPGTEHLSNLGAACVAAGIEYNPDMLRHTTVEDDLRELLGIYDMGGDVSDVGLKVQHSKLFNRLKRRLGRKGWLDVYRAAESLKGTALDFRRFFRHAPKGVYVIDGVATHADNPFDVLQHVLEAWVASGGSATPHTLLYDAPADLRNLWKRAYNDDSDKALGIVSKIVGVSWRRGVYGFAPLHVDNHKPLRSGAEAVVDGVLALAVDGYEDGHRHDVALTSLVKDIAFAGSPYKGSRSPTVDIVYGGKVIEVSFCSERLNARYHLRTAWKVEVLEQAGVEVAWLHYEDGVQACAKVLADVFDVDETLVERKWRGLVTRGTS